LLKGALPRLGPGGPLRKALRKAGRYAELGEPFIIAVNVLDTFADEISFKEALLGRECIRVTRAAEGVDTANADIRTACGEPLQDRYILA